MSGAPLRISPSLVRSSILPLFIAAYGVFSLLLMLVFLLGSDLGHDNNRPTIVVHRPFMPAITDAIVYVTPDAVREAVTSGLIAMRDHRYGKRIIALRYPSLQSGMPTLHLSDDTIFVTGVRMLVVWISLGAFLWMLYTLAQASFPESRAYALFAPLLALLLLFAFVVQYAYTYDFSELFFSCACLMLIFRQRWYWYLALLAVATLNKETTLFAIAFFAIYGFSRLPVGRYLALLAAQFAVYAATRAAVMLYFGHEPSLGHSGFGGTILDHLSYLYGYGYTSFTGLLVGVLLVTYQWPAKPEFLRWAVWMAPVTYAAYMLTCHPGEYRDLYWCMPPLILLATHTLVSLSGVQRMYPFAEAK